tara:strand:- start:45 stop:347 length:303 start_codon:yes stop_codon:yes gene_type:complete
MKVHLHDALVELGIHAYIRNNDYDTIVWGDPNKTISKSDLEAKVAEMQSAEDAIQYKKDRASQYPSIQDQLDMQYWDAVNGTNKWQEAIAKVKTDNPKPE